MFYVEIIYFDASLINNTHKYDVILMINILEYLTIIRRRRGDYRGIFTETKSSVVVKDLSGSKFSPLWALPISK